MVTRRSIGRLSVPLRPRLCSLTVQTRTYHRGAPNELRIRHRQCRTFASVAEKQPNIAVLGGGITGLASAYFLSQEFPDAKITLFEAKETLGGWVKSTKIDVGDGEVMFESGPRSLRPQAPAGTIALKLTQELGLINDLLVTPKTAPAAQNRFIYYPDHLVRMPGPGQQMTDILKAFIFEPAFKGIASGLYREITSPKRPDTLADESIGSFISRRISPHIADNLASALFHGIYAGDIYKLSAKTIMPIPWMREGKHGSLANAAFQQMTEKTSWNFCDDMELQTKLQETEWDPELEQRMADCSVFTYRRGLGQMTERLEQKLINNGNIKIMKNTKIDQLEKDKDTSKIKLTYSSTEVTPTVPSFITSDDPRTYTHVVSTLPPQTTFSLFPPDIQSTRSTSMHRPLSTTMTSTPAVTVCVVNLYFKTPFLLTTLNPPGGLPESITHLEGFGYLLPRTLPFTQNPERALGVIFDSDISPDVHSTVSHADKGTRLTVMLGGHWWDGWTSFPDEAEAEEMALNVLARHLGIVEEPVAVRATLQQNCIPQYTVGHTARMSEAHTGLLEHFSGKLRVAGSWYTNVGVNDCLRAAYEVVQGLTKEVKHGEQGRNGDGEREGRTGLEKFAWGRPLALVKKEALGEVEVVEIEEKAMKMGYFEGVRVSKKQGQGVRRDE